MNFRKLQFGPFELSRDQRELRRDGLALPLGGRALDILIYLVERPGEVVTKSELIGHVWSDVTVAEVSVRVHVAAIRKALGDGQFGNRYIANIKGRGYSFVGSVAGLNDPETNGPDRHYEGILPARSCRMIGRDLILSEVQRHLREERFVTLLGPAASGRPPLPWLPATPSRRTSAEESILSTLEILPIRIRSSGQSGHRWALRSER